MVAPPGGSRGDPSRYRGCRPRPPGNGSAGTFDLVIDVAARLRDGRQRVVRVGEPAGVEGGEIIVRDIFTFVVERTATGGSVEGTFQATGIAPRVVNDMASRGIHVDSGVFSRPPSR